MKKGKVSNVEKKGTRVQTCISEKDQNLSNVVLKKKNRKSRKNRRRKYISNLKKQNEKL